MFRGIFGNTSSPAAAPSSASTLGYAVGSADGIHRDFEKIRGSIQTTNKKYREELSKYRELAKFNQQITQGYIRNLDAMIDVSRILNYYVEIFNLLKVELDKNEKVLGEGSLRVEDIGYLERLTRNKVDELGGKFMKETEDLKKLYSAYGKTQEISKVNEAQESFKLTSNSATQALENIRTIQTNGALVQGGRKKKANSVSPCPRRGGVKNATKAKGKKC
jgi:prefoldin subunit 5